MNQGSDGITYVHISYTAALVNNSSIKFSQAELKDMAKAIQVQFERTYSCDLTDIGEKVRITATADIVVRDKPDPSGKLDTVSLRGLDPKRDPPDALGHAPIPGDTAELIVPNALESKDLLGCAATHEITHTFGLGHFDSRANLMNDKLNASTELTLGQMGRIVKDAVDGKLANQGKTVEGKATEEKTAD